MADWVPSIGEMRGPMYLAIVQALEVDIRQGAVRDGTRLVSQREMAERLNVSIGTVSRAYTEAERRGLVSGEVGRGTFVRTRGPEPRQDGFLGAGWNFALNTPPDTDEAAVIARHLADVATPEVMRHLTAYLPHAGLVSHRSAMADWMSRFATAVDPDLLIVTPGAQHALDMALRLVAPQSATVLTEVYTFSGMFALASLSDYRLVGVEMDDAGLLPEALDRSFRETGARVLYATPTLQSPTGTVMPETRRADIAAVIRNHNAWLVEDDVYAFLPERSLRPIASWIPERAFFVTSFAKALAPGLRIGALVPPPDLQDRAIAAMRSTGWMASPVMAEVIARIILSGDMMRQVIAKRREAAARDAVARIVFRDLLPPAAVAAGYHVWLPLPKGQTLPGVLNQAMLRGITMAPPLAAATSLPPQPGVRLCLGGFVSQDELRPALETVRDIVTTTQSVSYV